MTGSVGYLIILAASVWPMVWLAEWVDRKKAGR